MRFTGICFLALFGLAQLTGAQSAPARRAQEADVVGCYALFDRTGRPAADSLYWAPAIARLDSSGRALKLAPKFDAGRPAGQPGAYRWSVGAGDSLRVLFHTGFSGTEFVLSRASRGDTLRGRAREHWDFGPPFYTDAGAATAVRIACPITGSSGRREPDA
jgi:hypothetical protein